MTSHTQCLLKKGTHEQVTWLPSRYAKRGCYVKLRQRGASRVMSGPDSGCESDDPGDYEHSEWDDGWLVAETYTTMDSGDANDRSQDWRRQHRASDAYRDSDGHWKTPNMKGKK